MRRVICDGCKKDQEEWFREQRIREQNSPMEFREVLFYSSEGISIRLDACPLCWLTWSKMTRETFIQRIRSYEQAARQKADEGDGIVSCPRCGYPDD